ncbi:MAG TPA: RNA polymerase sigma factor [Firmicutes bacterium]|nr:RNA polymerase sigma factor [Bacillota bacterium]
MSGTGNQPDKTDPRAQYDTLFVSLVEEYRAKVWFLAYQMLQNKDDADDACQEVFCRVFRQLSKFRGESKPYTWIYRITVNYCADVMRRRNYIQTISLDEDPGHSQDGESMTKREVISGIASRMGDPEEGAENREISKAIRDAIGKLPFHHKQCLILKEIYGLSYREISQIAEVPVGTVMSRLYHAKRRLKEMLGWLMETE